MSETLGLSFAYLGGLGNGGWRVALPTCLITFDRTRYSVPASFANRPISLRIYPERLEVVAEGHVICTHERIIDRSHRQPGRVIYDWRHYLAVVQRKPYAAAAPH